MIATSVAEEGLDFPVRFSLLLGMRAYGALSHHTVPPYQDHQYVTRGNILAILVRPIRKVAPWTHILRKALLYASNV